MKATNNTQTQVARVSNYNKVKSVCNSVILLVAFLSLLISCSSTKQTFSTSEKTAVFLPPKTEYYIEMYIEEIDGKKTKFKMEDTAEIDEGEHELRIRLESHPATGTAVIVGGIANLLLRTTTNKTFSSTINVNVEKGQVYRLMTEDFKDGLAIKLLNETTSEIESIHKFQLKDGNFESVF
jgi:hypothetical protein